MIVRARTRLAALLLLGSGAALLAREGYVGAKGLAAGVLIERALEASLEHAEPRRPWPWADHHPLARLAVPRLGLTRVVLSGASGSSLAFGPGHVDGTAPPGAPGNTVVAGHRDSWFSFLDELEPGDVVTLETPRGRFAYRVGERRVVDELDATPLDPTADDRLTLITCHPVAGALPTSERLVVTCLRQPRHRPAR